MPFINLFFMSITYTISPERVKTLAENWYDKDEIFECLDEYLTYLENSMIDINQPAEVVLKFIEESLQKKEDI